LIDGIFCINLILRTIILGQDILNFNIAALRGLIAVVSQEPVLFNCSIEDNIRYGNESISHEEVIEACRMANADDFISKLPEVF